MSEVNGQTVSQQPFLSTKLDKGEDPKPDSKMGDGSTEIATGPRPGGNARPNGAPMFREQPYNSQQQGALFPVHTIVVQPPAGQPKVRGNFSKAAAVAMNRRPPNPSTYFIQHRQQKSSATATVTTTNLNEVIVDEGPTVKQHLQEQQKQLKAKERMMEQQNRQTVVPKESNGASQIVTGQVIRDSRTEGTPQVVKTFTVQQLNSSGSLIVSNSRQLGGPQKRPPARPVPAEIQPRLLAPRSRVNISNLPSSNRKLKVIVSPGVATGFTTAAQKQQLAQAPYVVSTTPLPPTAPGPPHSSAQISVHPLPPQGMKTVTVQKKLFTNDHRIRKQPVPIRRHPDQPSEFHVVTTVTPVTTPSAIPKPPPRRHFTPPPMADKLGELPLAILEGEEEIIAKEQARREEERLKKEADMAAFEKHVRELKEREQRYLDQMEKEKREEELKRFEQRHQEQQKILDEKIAREMQLKHDREKEQRRRRDEERRQLQAQIQQQQKMEEKKQEEEPKVQVPVEPSVSQPSSQVVQLEGEEQEEKDHPVLGQADEPQNHLMMEPLGEVNLDDILQVGGDLAWNYQGVEQELYHQQQPVEPYPFEMPHQEYYNEPPMPHPHHYDLSLHQQQLAGYPADLTQQMNDPQQQVIHPGHPHPGYLDTTAPIDDLFDKDNSLDKLLADDPLNLDNFTDVLNDPNLMDSFPDFMDDSLCKKPAAAKKNHSPDNVMSLIDWISNDDHDIGDDGDDLLGLRDERLESTATEYLNVCADVDFAMDLDIGSNDGGEPRPTSSVANHEAVPTSLPITTQPMEQNPQLVSVSLSQISMLMEQQGMTLTDTNFDPGASVKARRKGRSPQGKEETPLPRSNRRRTEDRHTRQRKAEMDALEKEREAKQIAADRERVKQIMEMELKAIQAEKDAEALNKGPPPKKKSRSGNSRRGASVQRQDGSPTKSAVSTPTSGATPLARTPDHVMPQPAMGMELDASLPLVVPPQALVPVGSYDGVPLKATLPVPMGRPPQPMQMQGCTTTTSITGPIIATRTDAPMPSATYYPATEPGPVPYADPAQYLQHHQQNYAMPPQNFAPQPLPQHQPEQYPPPKTEQQPFIMDMNYEERMQNQYPTVAPYMGYQNGVEMAYPQQEYPWYPMEQYYSQEPVQPELYQPQETMIPPRPERTQSMDAAHDMEESETAKKKNRRSNSFTNGMDVDMVESLLEHPTYQYDIYGNVVAVHQPTKEELDSTIVNYLTNDGTTVSLDKDLEAAILSGNAEALEEVLQTKEATEIVESYNTVPIDILFTMMDSPHEFFTSEELAILANVHGIDTTEQLKVNDTNIGIEVPRDILEAQDFDLLEDYEWKRILLQSFLHFIDEEKEEELAYMEEQCYAAHVEDEQRFATKMEVLKKGLTSFLYNNTAMLDEITRLAGKLMVTSEERKVLARRLCHHQRNYIRRLQTASKRRSDAERRKLENGTISSPEKAPFQDQNALKKSHKKKLPPTPPAIAAARKSTVDRLVEEIMKTSKKRGRPFTKDLQKSISLPNQLPTPATPIAVGAAKKKERTASVSSVAKATLAPPPITSKRHSAPDSGAATPGKEKSKERPPRKDSRRDSRREKKEEPVVVPKKDTPEIVVTPPKVEHPNLEEKKEEKEKEEPRSRRARDRRQPPVKYEEPKEKEEEEEDPRPKPRRRERKEKSKEPAEPEKQEEKPKRKRERRMKGYVYEEEPIAPPEPEPEPEPADPDAPIGLRKSARKSAQYLNFIDFSPRNTPDPDDRRKRPGRPRVEDSSSPSVERRQRSRRGRSQNDSLSEDVKEVDSSPNTTASGPDGISPNTSLGENDNTTTSPDTPASDPPKEEDKASEGRRSLRARRPTQKQEESKDYEDETPKKRRRNRTESSSTTASTSSNPPVEKVSTRQSTRRRS